VLVARRVLLMFSVQLAAAGVLKAASANEASADANLEYRGGWLVWGKGRARAAIGRAGVTTHKTEGDGATPAGVFPLISAFYRADRIAPPRTSLPFRALQPSDAWVDDPADGNYNRLVELPNPAHAEPMWLDDAVYDLLVVIGYNMAPVVRGAGSAIFLHVARPDFSPTAGCIAIEKSTLVSLLPLLGPASMMTIRI
jgi:L,D-peptidoglycan transpeptidase YkuD (ErfK/YbiS/YcfS/YnhG family)